MTVIKQADIGGGERTNFEQAFANLGSSYIRDRCPQLLDKQIGFQVIDKDADNTKAVGVFAFQVGSQWLYVPVFFLNGDLKGHELLYLKNQDIFVPLKENWINYLLNKKPSILGSSVNRNLSQLGVMQPSLYQLTRSPEKAGHFIGNNKATKVADWAAGFLPGLAKTLYKQASRQVTVNLVEFLQDFVKSAGLAGVTHLVKDIGEHYPDVIVGLDRYYPNLLDNFVKQASKEPSILDKQAKFTWRDYLFGPRMPLWLRTALLATAGGALGTEAAINAEDKLLWSPGNALKYLAAPMAAGSLLGVGSHYLREGVEPKKQHDSILRHQDEPTEPGILDKQAMHPALIAALIGGGIGAATGATVSGLPSEAETFFKLFANRQLPSYDLKKALLYATAGTGLGAGVGLGSYGISAGLKKLKDDDTKQASIPKVKVQVLNQVKIDKSPLLRNSLSEQEQEKLLREQVIVRDQRDDKEVTLAYNVQSNINAFSPGETGLYQILVKPDKFVTCLVVYHPHSHRGRQDYVTVVRLDNNAWLNIHPSYLYAISQSSKEDFKDWFDKQKDVDTLKLGKGKYLILAPSGAGTVPLTVKQEINAGVTCHYRATFYDHCDNQRPGYLPYVGRRPDNNDHQHTELSHVQINGYVGSKTQRNNVADYQSGNLVLTGVPGSTIVVTVDAVKVPNTCKLLKLVSADDTDHDSKVDSSKIEAIQPGNILDIQLALHNQTLPLKLTQDGSGVKINNKPKVNKQAALEELIVTYNLREKVAQQLLEETEVKKHTTYLLKLAQPQNSNPMITGAPSAPPWPELAMGQDTEFNSQLPTQEETERSTPVPDLLASNTDRYGVYRPTQGDHRAYNLAQQAAQTGQKELFDTSMLSGLLNAVQDSTIIDKYLPVLMQSLDALGRLLFNLYWHGEEFQERYGKEEMPEVEDSLRNVFESTGDLTLKLKSKRVDDYLDKVDLSPIANK